jgi:glycosyltransferase involved in cell wall biosynthesis
MNSSSPEPALSLCMIVRDEADRIERTIRRHAALADEIVVVDTGSIDATAQLARQAGARVERLDWNDDFAAPRNASLAAARGRWALVLDADEWIEEQDFAVLRALCAAPARTVAYSLLTRTYTNDSTLLGWQAASERPAEAADFSGYYTSTKVRLFPRLP